MKTKFKVGDETHYKGNVYVVLAVNAYWTKDFHTLISYKLQGLKSWVYEHQLEVII